MGRRAPGARPACLPPQGCSLRKTQPPGLGGAGLSPPPPQEQEGWQWYKEKSKDAPGWEEHYFLIHKKKKLMSEKISYTQRNLLNQLGLQIA